MTNKKVATKKQKKLLEEAARRLAGILIKELERQKEDKYKKSLVKNNK